MSIKSGKTIQPKKYNSTIAFLFAAIGMFSFNQAYALEDIWNTESLEYLTETGTFDCSGCHEPNQNVTALNVDAPSSVPFDAVKAEITLNGYNSNGGKSFFRYITSDDAQQLSDARNSTGNRTEIDFAVDENPVVLRYCMLDAAGSSGTSGRSWNCDNLQILRDPKPNEPPTIVSPIPGTQAIEVGSSAFTFPVQVEDDQPSPEVLVTSSNPDFATVTSSGSGSYTVTPVAEGDTTITIRVTDSDDVQVSATFPVEVSAAEFVPPVIVVPPVEPPVVEPPVLPPVVEPPVLPPVVEPPVEPPVVEPPVVPPVVELPVEPPVVPPVVEEVNTAPTASPDSFAIAADSDEVVLDVLSNDTDLDDDPLSIQLDGSLTTQGNSVSVSGLTVVYTVTSALLSDDFFSYRAKDDNDAFSESVVVTLKPSDSDNDGTIDALDNCALLPNADQADMDNDNQGDLCDLDPDGDGQTGIIGVEAESGRELVEAECLVCHLTGVSGATLIGDTEAWNARIDAAGGELEDLLPSVLNGLGAMPAFGAQFNTAELIQAIRFLTGREVENPTQTPEGIDDRDLDGVDDSIDNCNSVPNPDQIDTNNNGVGDLCEPTADGDGDGIPFSLDDNDSNARRLIASSTGSNNSVFSSESDLSLGRVAKVAASASNFESASVVLSFSQYSQHLATVFPGISASVDEGHSSLMGISNISVETNGSTGEFIIQLDANLPLDAVLRVVDTSSGLWRDYESGSGNVIASAPDTDAACPVASSENYQPGLSAGLECVRLTIVDGGLNDADGSVNGQAELMADIAQKIRSGTNTGEPAVIDLNPSSGGGSVSHWIVFMMLLWGFIRNENRALVREQS